MIYMREKMDWIIQFSLCMIKQYLQQIGQIVATLKNSLWDCQKINKNESCNKQKPLFMHFCPYPSTNRSPFLCIFVQGRQQPKQSHLIQTYSVDWTDVYDTHTTLNTEQNQLAGGKLVKIYIYIYIYNFFKRIRVFWAKTFFL